MQKLANLHGKTCKIKTPILRVRVPSVTPLFSKKYARFQVWWQKVAVFFFKLHKIYPLNDRLQTVKRVAPILQK